MSSFSININVVGAKRSTLRTFATDLRSWAKTNDILLTEIKVHSAEDLKSSKDEVSFVIFGQDLVSNQHIQDLRSKLTAVVRSLLIDGAIVSGSSLYASGTEYNILKELLEEEPELVPSKPGESTPRSLRTQLSELQQILAVVTTEKERALAEANIAKSALELAKSERDLAVSQRDAALNEAKAERAEKEIARALIAHDDKAALAQAYLLQLREKEKELEELRAKYEPLDPDRE